MERLTNGTSRHQPCTVATRAGQTEVLRWLDEEWIDIYDAPPSDDEDGL